MDKYQITFNTWNSVAGIYQEMFMNLDIYNESYDLFCQHIDNPEASLLEIGCGPGNITRYLLHKNSGYKITGIDVAGKMIELAKINNPSASFITMDARNIRELTTKFDAVIAGFCIPYLAKDDLEKMMKHITDLLNPGGVLYISYIEGNYHADSGFEKAGTGDSSFVYYYEQAYMRSLLERNNFGHFLFIQKEFIKNDKTTQTQSIYIARSL